MALSLPETFRFDFTTSWSTGTFPPIIEACSKMNFTFKTIDNIEESPFSPYYVQFYVQANGIPPYSFSGGSFKSTDKGELDLPFNNSQAGTQFVTCMYTSNGQTGGCQNLYTVIESRNDCTVNPPPVVGNALTVSMQTPSAKGDLTDLGWYSSWPTGCTDIHFKVDGGTSPYLLTIANAYIPPRNYTFESNSFEWKVDLARGYPFFLSVFDSAGHSFTAGPLHVGGGGSTSCLATSGASGNPGAFAGAAMGGIVFGALVALASLWGMRTWRKKHPKPLFSPVEENFAPTPFVDRASSLREPGGPNAPLSRTETGGGRSPPTSPRGAEGDSRGRNVFVVHHDGGGAPVSVFTDADSQVFELPPSYLNAGPTTATPSANASRSSRRRPPPLDRSTSDPPKHAEGLLPLPSLEWEAYRNSLLSPSSITTPAASRPPRTSDDVSSSSPTTTKTELPPLPLEATSTLSSYVGATPTSSDQALLGDGSTERGGAVEGSRRPAGAQRDWSDQSERGGGVLR